MFERFTDRARRALVVAQEEARSLEHDFIRPEHLLLALFQGDGLAAQALAEAGADYAEVRQSIVVALASSSRAAALDKVPFSPQTKTVLELSLREALRLGHNYIGTEHLLLGLLRGAENQVADLLGERAASAKVQVMALLSTLGHGGGPRSPALTDALARARRLAGQPAGTRRLAGQSAVTTGHVLRAIADDARSQGARALAGLGVTATALTDAVAAVALDDTTDAVAPPAPLTVVVGDRTTTIDDPDVVRTLRGASAEQIRAALTDAFGAGPGPADDGPGA